MKLAVFVSLFSLGIILSGCANKQEPTADLKVQQTNEIEKQSDKTDDKTELNAFQDSNGFFKFQYPKNLVIKTEKSDSGELNRIVFFKKENSSSRIVIGIWPQKLDDAAVKVKNELEFTAQEQLTIGGRVGLKLTLVLAVDKLVILPLDASNSLRLEVRGSELNQAFEKILETIIFLKS